MPRASLLIHHADPERPPSRRWSRENRLYTIIMPGGLRMPLRAWCAGRDLSYDRVRGVVRYWPLGGYTSDFSAVVDWARAKANPLTIQFKLRRLTRRVRDIRDRLGG